MLGYKMLDENPVPFLSGLTSDVSTTFLGTTSLPTSNTKKLLEPKTSFRSADTTSPSELDVEGHAEQSPTHQNIILVKTEITENESSERYVDRRTRDVVETSAPISTHAHFTTDSSVNLFTPGNI